MADLLKNPYYQAAIFLASKSLYQELEKGGFEYNNLGRREKTSLQKYFNRMCYRPTPFSLFAGFSTGLWGKPTGPLVISDQLKVHRYINYKQSLALASEIISRHLTSVLTYSPNSILYTIKNEYRYLRYQHHTEEQERTFFIDSIDQSAPLNAIFEACNSAMTKDELSKLLANRFPFSAKDIGTFLEKLINEQVLVSTLEPNISGNDYLKRVLMLCDQININKLCGHVFQVAKISDNASTRALFTDLSSVEHDLWQESPPKKRNNSLLYVILEKPEVLGELDTAYQEKILEGLNCIHRLIPAQTPPALESFASTFRTKYERRSVSLLEAMDPEIGIGYESLADSSTSSLLLRNMYVNYVKKNKTTIEWSEIHIFLMNKLQRGEQTINLNQAEIDNLPAPSASRHLPPSISVLFRPCGEMLYIENAGGATATSLLGRFSLANDQVWESCKEMAFKEESANPEVIFAEIAHVGDMHSANIERRKAVRQYEIPVATGTTVDPAYKIPLSDLWLTVYDNEIILWSKKHKKRVIPRLTSAYNYKRSPLAVYRFLCDLQYQSLAANMSFDLSWFFPGLSYYPRVVYKSVILQLASWHIEKKQLRSILGEKSTLENTLKLSRLAEKQNWPRYVSLNNHDHQLIFDIKNENDLRFLAEVLRKQQQEICIKEFPFVENVDPAVIDRNKKPYIAQFVASLYHENPVYQIPEYSFSGEKNGHSPQRAFIAGSEWLYVKLYCHPSRSNELLIHHILPIVETLKAKKLLKKWFFIRYQDNGYHLRVRFRVDPLHISVVLSHLNKGINDFIPSGIVRRFQLDVYERELERYSPELIDHAESIFCKSSELVLHYLKDRDLSEVNPEYLRFAFSTIDTYLKIFKWSPESRAQVLRRLYMSFYEELQDSGNLKEQLKRKHRELRTDGILLIKPLRVFFDGSASGIFVSEFEDILEAFKSKTNNWSLTRKQVMISDLIHMQLNRHLTDNHRKQEMIIYYCLWKEYTSVAARIKLGQALAF